MDKAKKLNRWAWILWGISSLGVLACSAWICYYAWSIENFLVYVLPAVLGMSVFSLIFIWSDRIGKNKSEVINEQKGK